MLLICLGGCPSTHTSIFNERQQFGPQGECGFSGIGPCSMRVQSDSLCFLPRGFRFKSELPVCGVTGYSSCLEPKPTGERASALQPAGWKPSWGSTDAGSKSWQFRHQTRSAPSEMVKMVQSTHGSSRRASSGYWADALSRKNTAQCLQMKS